MSRRIIKLGKWNNKILEWEVLKENDFELLVVCRTSVDKRKFDSDSSNNSWKKSELRRFLQEVFYKKAFSVEEKQKIISTKLKDVNGSKDNVFVLSYKEVSTLFLGGDDYEYNDKSCGRCAWTRTKINDSIYHGYSSGCWCQNRSTYIYSVRPAMYIDARI